MPSLIWTAQGYRRPRSASRKRASLKPILQANRGKKVLTVGTKAQVWHGTAKHTAGYLYKKDLMFIKKTGRIVSIKKHKQGLKMMGNLIAPKYKKKSQRSKHGGAVAPQFVPNYEQFYAPRAAGFYEDPRIAGAYAYPQQPMYYY